jgi:hypothetical protein
MFELIESKDDSSSSDIAPSPVWHRSPLGQMWFELPDAIKRAPIAVPVMFAMSFLPGRSSAGKPIISTWLGHIAFGLIAGMIVAAVPARRRSL